MKIIGEGGCEYHRTFITEVDEKDMYRLAGYRNRSEFEEEKGRRFKVGDAIALGDMFDRLDAIGKHGHEFERARAVLGIILEEINVVERVILAAEEIAVSEDQTKE